MELYQIQKLLCSMEIMGLRDNLYGRENICKLHLITDPIIYMELRQKITKPSLTQCNPNNPIKNRLKRLNRWASEMGQWICH